jgi:transposase
MSYYAGIDLHSNNSYIGVLDKKGRKIFQERLSNDLALILKALAPFKKQMKGIVVESTFNWYWLVDGLMEAGYKIHLANPCAIQQYKGLKFSDDKSDALWLAEMLRLDILPEGYIYPKKERAIRDLLRRRLILVLHRTSLMLSLKGMISNIAGTNISRSELQRLSNEEIDEFFFDPHDVRSGQSFNDLIKDLSMEIKKLEKTALEEVQLKKEFKCLLTVSGIGKVLGLTIMLETGDFKRFQGAGNFSSYSRCVPAKRISNEKKKGSGNKKNGNRYLAWAFTEAAHYMQRYCPQAKKWFQQKAAKSGRIVATKALSNKIARACYFIMRDQKPFNPSRLFG